MLRCVLVILRYNFENKRAAFGRPVYGACFGHYDSGTDHSFNLRRRGLLLNHYIQCLRSLIKSLQRYEFHWTLFEFILHGYVLCDQEIRTKGSFHKIWFTDTSLSHSLFMSYLLIKRKAFDLVSQIIEPNSTIIWDCNGFGIALSMNCPNDSLTRGVNRN